MKSLSELEDHLGIVFSSKFILEEALTHKSRNKGAKNYKSDNERLEFFGDAVLKLIMTEHLFHEYPKFKEGQLSKLRSQYVSDKYMEAMALSIHLGDYIEMSSSEIKSGGRQRSSILANAMEALLGACYLDQGYKVTQDLFLRMFKRVQESDGNLDLEDYKSSLQERCQKLKILLPRYRLTKKIGPEHDREFEVEGYVCIQEADLLAHGKGRTKKEAEQHAAEKLLELVDTIKL